MAEEEIHERVSYHFLAASELEPTSSAGTDTAQVSPGGAHSDAGNQLKSSQG
jgi:hypothetical protein